MERKPLPNRKPLTKAGHARLARGEQLCDWDMHVGPPLHDYDRLIRTNPNQDPGGAIIFVPYDEVEMTHCRLALSRAGLKLQHLTPNVAKGGWIGICSR